MTVATAPIAHISKHGVVLCGAELTGTDPTGLDTCTTCTWAAIDSLNAVKTITTPQIANDAPNGVVVIHHADAGDNQVTQHVYGKGGDGVWRTLGTHIPVDFPRMPATVIFDPSEDPFHV